MIPYVRQRKIKEELENREMVYIEDLAELFEDVSVSTIRRDLKTLEEEGQIEIFRGGGVKLKNVSYDLPVGTKKNLFKEEKEQIAKFAASLVENHDVIYVDSGTTCLQMMKYLKEKTITVITTNTQVINEVVGTPIKCILIGGEVNTEIDSISGPMTDAALRNLYFAKSFLGTSGYSLENGVNTFDLKEATKKAIINEKSKKCYVLADHSKCNRNTLCKAFDLNECIFITDKATKLLEEYAEFMIAE